MQLGTAKLSITPQKPVRLCGYATRTTAFDEVKEDIFLRVQLHQHENETLLFLYADLLWWGSDFVNEAYQKIAGICDIPSEHIFFVASHNHSGPPTSKSFTPTLETYDADYAQFLLNRIVEGVLQAMQDIEPVTACRYNGSTALNVFRRVMVDGEIKMKPNYEVPADHTLTILAFHRPDGSLKASMLHYPCHANLSDGNAVQPDYPGIALRMLDDTYSGSVSIFLQGCTADLRPNSVLGHRFISNSYERVLIFAEDFYNDCKALLQQKAEQITPQFRVKKQLLPLPLEGVLTMEELKIHSQTQQGVEREWAEAVLAKDNRPTEELELSWIDYGDHLRFYTFNAEVSQYYAAFARELDPKAICIAYTNGMIGYLSTAEQIAQGGYEPKGSALYFALAGTYKPEIEEIIHGAMRTAAE
ncbi:alkaline ceramidase [Oscillospiraceae bacterium PP1C4]